jgi:aminoglycoside phosphotransferase (APT) family kinase protein
MLAVIDAADVPERGELIAEGRTAHVYAAGPHRIVKVLRPGFPDTLGEEEAAAARVADQAGVGAPRFFGMGRVDDCIALIYERRDGPSMMEQLGARVWRAGPLGATFGTLHAGLHGTPAASLPRFRDAVLAAVRRAEPIAGSGAHDAAIAQIERLPDGASLCHGDFHPGNVMLSASGPSVIDWLTASAGPPAADVARTLILLREGALPDGLPRTQRLRIGLLRRWFVGAYLRAYRHARPLDLGEVAGWRLPLLVARLDEGIEAERSHLLRRIGEEMGASAGEQPHRVEE